ncbi:MAG: hypothetical protein JWR18_2881 [Segetibacter sp.]|nr:hypothetical protein [Segetibacter sp.]
MKLLGHPIHLMLIHFPAALFPMELVCYYIQSRNGDTSFAYASFYAMAGGVLFGWLAIITGAIDLITIRDDGALQVKALVHGAINSAVVLTYTVVAYLFYKHYPNLPIPTKTLLALKASLNLVMIAGNYLGGNLVLKHKLGVIQSNTKTI